MEYSKDRRLEQREQRDGSEGRRIFYEKVLQWIITTRYQCALNISLTFRFTALKAVYLQEWKAYKPMATRGSKTQAFLFIMLKTLLPESPIFSNTIILSQNMIIEGEDQLRIFEFDVSFVTSTSVAD
jgi:hypothetical protein